MTETQYITLAVPKLKTVWFRVALISQRSTVSVSESAGSQRYVPLFPASRVFLRSKAHVDHMNFRRCYTFFAVFNSQDMMDDICQEQFLELSYLNGVPEPSRGRGVPVRGRGAAPPPPPVPR